jgi:hypothetical protein
LVRSAAGNRRASVRLYAERGHRVVAVDVAAEETNTAES